jgi:hypothetical protein
MDVEGRERHVDSCLRGASDLRPSAVPAVGGNSSPQHAFTCPSVDEVTSEYAASSLPPSTQCAPVADVDVDCAGAWGGMDACEGTDGRCPFCLEDLSVAAVAAREAHVAECWRRAEEAEWEAPPPPPIPRGERDDGRADADCVDLDADEGFDDGVDHADEQRARSTSVGSGASGGLSPARSPQVPASAAVQQVKLSSGGRRSGTMWDYLPGRPAAAAAATAAAAAAGAASRPNAALAATGRRGGRGGVGGRGGGRGGGGRGGGLWSGVGASTLALRGHLFPSFG